MISVERDSILGCFQTDNFHASEGLISLINRIHENQAHSNHFLISFHLTHKQLSAAKPYNLLHVCSCVFLLACECHSTARSSEASTHPLLSPFPLTPLSHLHRMCLCVHERQERNDRECDDLFLPFPTSQHATKRSAGVTALDCLSNEMCYRVT